MRNRYKNLLRNKSLTFWGHIKYLYSVAIFMLRYRDKKDVLKRFKIHRERESNVNNKPINEIFEEQTQYCC